MGKQGASKVASQRIEYLYELAQQELEKNPELSRRSIQMMRELATKHNILTTEKNKTFCKNCFTLLIPGKTCTVRVNKHRVITCSHCGEIKRLGITEQ